MDDRPRIGIGVIDLDLIGRQAMFEDVIFDTGETERPGDIEALHLQVAGDQFHRRDPATPQTVDECAAIGEGGGRTPQAKPGGISEIVDVRRAGCRHVQDAGTGQQVLQAHAGDALIGSLLRAETAFAAGDTRHFVRLVEHHHTVKIITDPVEDLLKASALVAPVGAERRIGEEEHTLGRAYGRAQFPLVEMLDVERETADRVPVATCVLQQCLGLGYPDVLAAPA